MLIRGDARNLPLRDRCVDCVVTSPPYYGLRNYGDTGQIGLEDTPDDYVQSLVGVFREVRRVLSDVGSVWINLGDSYVSNGRYESDVSKFVGNLAKYAHRDPRVGARAIGAKSKDLLMIPARVALALQADGWYLRSDIIWHKPNPMPESVNDRPTTAHEHLFLFTKRPVYYYDAGSIAEPTSEGKRNKRTIWTIPTAKYDGAHFATMPEELVEPCVLAGSPIGGLVLDPFVGSGTVVSVAQRLGRRGVGVDLSYQDVARERTAQRGIPFRSGEDDEYTGTADAWSPSR